MQKFEILLKLKNCDAGTQSEQTEKGSDRLT